MIIRSAILQRKYIVLNNDQFEPIDLQHTAIIRSIKYIIILLLPKSRGTQQAHFIFKIMHKALFRCKLTRNTLHGIKIPSIPCQCAGFALGTMIKTK